MPLNLPAVTFVCVFVFKAKKKKKKLIHLNNHVGLQMRCRRDFLEPLGSNVWKREVGKIICLENSDFANQLKYTQLLNL